MSRIEIEEDDEFYLASSSTTTLETDFNVETLLRNSRLTTPTIFGQSWTMIITPSTNGITTRIDDVSTPIEWLIATQVIARRFYQRRFALKSPFLTSLSEELYDYDTEPMDATHRDSPDSTTLKPS